MTEPAADGFFHPASEDELVALVRHAADKDLQLRVWGAGHSVPAAICPHDKAGKFDLGVMKVKLDHYASWRIRDEDERIIVADAGIHLGADPSDPLATLKKSLLYQLWHDRRWTLSDLGGITHQTVSGFSATASAGGSIKYSFEDNVVGFRVIDGRGNLTEIGRGDPRFWAMVPNLGLLGVVSAVIFQCVEAFDIVGCESVSTVENCKVDILGKNDGRPTLEAFLRETDYARLEWWPQRGVECVTVWQASRAPYDAGRRRAPYRRFGRHPTLAQIGICVFYTVLGNAGRSRSLHIKLPTVYAAISRASNVLVAGAIAVLTSTAICVLEVGSRTFVKNVPRYFPRLLNLFLHRDDKRRGSRRGEPQWFSNDSWRGLPMDNVLSDELVPVQFTEIFVPLGQATALVQCMEKHFEANDVDPSERNERSYDRTGLFTFELYAAKPSRSWLNPAFTTGKDVWKHGAFRFNSYWFTLDAQSPEEGTLRGIWDEVYKSGIPFRLHWGKLQPEYDRPKGERSWVDVISERYDNWGSFLRLRNAADPEGLFLTPYWRKRLGLGPPP